MTTQTLLYNPKPRRDPSIARKERNQRINEAAREAGVIKTLVKRTEEERKAKRAEYGKARYERDKKETRGLWEMKDTSGRSLKDFQRDTPTLEYLRDKIFDSNDGTEGEGR